MMIVTLTIVNKPTHHMQRAILAPVAVTEADVVVVAVGVAAAKVAAEVKDGPV